MIPVATLILAAGGSTRMGKPKPLLRLRRETLLARAIRAAWGAGTRSVAVVAGGPDETALEAIVREAKAARAAVVMNSAWREGVSTSIRAGLAAVEADLAIEGVLFLAVDQPFVESADLVRLLSARESGASMAAADYGNGAVGIPAFFGRPHFPALQLLEGDAGAKRILEAEAGTLLLVSMPTAATDVDSSKDCRRWGIE